MSNCPSCGVHIGYDRPPMHKSGCRLAPIKERPKPIVKPRKRAEVESKPSDMGQLWSCFWIHFVISMGALCWFDYRLDALEAHHAPPVEQAEGER